MMRKSCVCACLLGMWEVTLLGIPCACDVDISLSVSWQSFSFSFGFAGLIHRLSFQCFIQATSWDRDGTPFSLFCLVQVKPSVQPDSIGYYTTRIAISVCIFSLYIHFCFLLISMPCYMQFQLSFTFSNIFSFVEMQFLSGLFLTTCTSVM